MAVLTCNGGGGRCSGAEGILCIWNDNRFKVERRSIGVGFIMLTGKWKQESQPVHLINIYSPCNLQDKRMLWENIRQLKYQSPEGYWCIVGDFNNIRNAAERMGSSQRGQKWIFWNYDLKKQG